MKTFQEYLNEVKKPTGDLKKACWDGYTAVGTKQKGGRTVPNCVPEEIVKEAHGPWGKISQASLDKIAKAKKREEKEKGILRRPGSKLRKDTPNYVAKVNDLSEEEVEYLFDVIEEMVEDLACEFNVDAELIWEELEGVSDEELVNESAAWQRKEGKNPEGGLNRKGIASYRRENPGSKLSMAVTTKPSKLKPGSKAANRRKSFCARMGGMQGAMKKPNGEPTRKALALRKWNC